MFLIRISSNLMLHNCSVKYEDRVVLTSSKWHGIINFKICRSKDSDFCDEISCICYIAVNIIEGGFA